MQAAGWIVIILFGFLFALLAVFLVWVDIKFAGIVYNAEQFNTAGRNIGTGLLAVDVVGSVSRLACHAGVQRMHAQPVLTAAPRVTELLIMHAACACRSAIGPGRPSCEPLRPSASMHACQACTVAHGV